MQKKRKSLGRDGDKVVFKGVQKEEDDIASHVSQRLSAVHFAARGRINFVEKARIDAWRGII